MGIHLDTSGLESLLAQQESLRHGLARRIANGLFQLIMERWSSESPSIAGEPPAIVTGALAGSIQIVELDVGIYQVGTSTEYGMVLEFGSATMTARPWMRPAVEQIRQELTVIAQATFAEVGFPITITNEEKLGGR